jgi:hypothetical protein
MKKTITIFALAGITFLTACGPSAEELAKKEQATKDSIAAVEKARQDSLDAANRELAMQDSLAAAAKADSLAAAEAAAKASKGTKPKKKVEPKKVEPKKEEPKDKFGAATGGKTQPSKFDKVTGGDKKDATAPKSKFDKVLEKK